MTKIKKAMVGNKGWQHLIQETNEKLKTLNNPKLEFFPYQKYGTLRYNTGIYSTEEIDRIIDDAEEKSEHICIACGSTKEDQEKSLCKNCLAQFRKEEK